MKNALSSYTELLEKAGTHRNIPLPSFEKLIKWYNNILHYTGFNSSSLYFIDYIDQKYQLMLTPHKSILGYHESYIMQAGPQILFEICHPTDLAIIDLKIFPENFKYLNKNPCINNHKLSFSMTFRMKDKSGKYHQLNQCSSFVCISENGTPLAAIGTITDITLYKNDDRIIHIIENHSLEDENKRVVKYFYPSESACVLSEREVEVLKWICEGYCSKQIVEKMHISIHTINNHRKNILEKTNCKNFPEVLSYSIRYGII